MTVKWNLNIQELLEKGVCFVSNGKWLSENTPDLDIKTENNRRLSVGNAFLSRPDVASVLIEILTELDIVAYALGCRILSPTFAWRSKEFTESCQSSVQVSCLFTKDKSP